MSKFIQTHIFHLSTFSLSTKQKLGKLKYFLSFHFFIPSTKQALNIYENFDNKLLVGVEFIFLSLR